MKKALVILTWLLIAGTAFAAAAPDSKRLALAKDYIADEQWARAIDELRIVAADRNDPNRDEALFWLAHSEYQVGDHGEAIQTIARLERLFAKSRWVRPARSLRVEIAQRLRRDDVLWVLATQPPPPPPPAPVRGVAPSAHPLPRGGTPPAAPAPPALPATTPTPAPPPGFPATPRPTEFPSVPAATIPTPAPFPPGFGRRPPASPPMAARPGALPMGMTLDGLLPVEPYALDTDLRMQALVSLLDTHSDRVIPLLREIALDNKNPTEARRAVFALAQSPRSDARNTVVEAARRGPGAVRIAAIREMGRFHGPVFTTALVGIARSESDAAVRDTAIVTLGRSGARVQLRSLYSQLPSASRFAVLTGLFTAKDDDELIRIASTERDQRLRTRARQHLRLLGTAKSVKFLAENP
jgi:hypothetical protein